MPMRGVDMGNPMWAMHSCRETICCADQEKMKQMEREIKELKRANEILRKAAAFFAQAELDRPHK